jgi:formylglycine-generating enzyme required for sulfatase activity
VKHTFGVCWLLPVHNGICPGHSASSGQFQRLESGTRADLPHSEYLTLQHIAFISYATQDYRTAASVCAALERSGISCWIAPRDIPDGGTWANSVTLAVEQSQIVLILLSAHANLSPFVERETHLAVAARRAILPIRLDASPLSPTLAFLVGPIQWSNLSEPLDENTLHDLLGRVEAAITAPRSPASTLGARIQYGQVSRFEWCDIPGGIVRTGGNQYEIGAFLIGKYPLTTVQWDEFIHSAGGFKDVTWWEFSTAAIHHRRAVARSSGNTAPSLPHNLVCWYDAVAYTRWLGQRLGMPIALPTEAQWQRAAQGDDGRSFPWGNHFDRTRCNTAESNLRGPSPVDAYPEGISVYGVHDLAGNVWEWCLNVAGRPNSINPKTVGQRAVRGGSWMHTREYATTSYREQCQPAAQFSFLGFRVAISDRSTSHDEGIE